MMCLTPIDRSTSREIAQELIAAGDKDFQIKIGNTVVAAMNPGGVLGENIAQLITDLRREVMDLVDAIRPIGSHGSATTQIAELKSENEDLKDRINELRLELDDFEESCGRLAK